MEKRIITWKWGNNPTNDEYTTTRAFIFGNYADSFDEYVKLVNEAKVDFPTIKDVDITCSKVTESTYMKGFIVISFLLPADTKHSYYQNWDRFDFGY